MSDATTSGVDAATANRIRGEWETVKGACQTAQPGPIQDPLGQDGEVELTMAYFRNTGAGEVVFRKGSAPADRRYTRFRTWGASGSDFIEKSSYLVKENGTTEFHKRRVEPGDNVVAIHELDGEDQGWANGLA